MSLPDHPAKNHPKSITRPADSVGFPQEAGAGRDPAANVVRVPKVRRRWFRRRTTPGLPPGTISPHELNRPARMELFSYSAAACHETTPATIAEVAPLLVPEQIHWLNIDGYGSADLLKGLAAQFKIHPLAMEDVVNTHQRAKVDNYDDQLFVVARRVVGPPFCSEQISFVLAGNVLLTFQEDLDGDCFDNVRERLRNNRGRTRSSGSDYLLYELLDAVIDSYFPVIEKMGEDLDRIEELVQNHPSPNSLRLIHSHRADLLQLRRAAWPLREAVQHLLRGEFPQITRETLLYLRDGYDHVVQIMDILDIYRETCGDLRDYYYNIVSSRTNDVMRTLTIISTLFLPMTFVAGVYGMNFQYMPELAQPWGYPACLAFMAMIGIGFLLFFWRKGWLHSFDRERGDDGK
jgi:magnesium transporter